MRLDRQHHSAAEAKAATTLLRMKLPLPLLLLLQCVFLHRNAYHCEAFTSISTHHSTSSTHQSRREQQLYSPAHSIHSPLFPSTAGTSVATLTQRRQQLQRSTRQSSTSTARSAFAAVDPYSFVVAASAAISGGLFAGGLHAVAGPDHLAALLPRCCGQRWYRAGRVGALWGMGHGVSATILGIAAFAVKKTVQNKSSGFILGSARLQSILSGASHVMEIAVGLSLVLIGVMGIREAREWKEDIATSPSHSLSAAVVATDAADLKRTAESRAVVLNGVLHGFSWDGAPSLAPALALATWSGNLAFLMAYAVGTMSAMALVTTLVGEGTRRAGQVFQRPDIPQKLSMVSSIVAIVIGVVWCGLGLR